MFDSLIVPWPRSSLKISCRLSLNCENIGHPLLTSCPHKFWRAHPPTGAGDRTPAITYFLLKRESRRGRRNQHARRVCSPRPSLHQLPFGIAILASRRVRSPDHHHQTISSASALILPPRKPVRRQPH